jgi:hypothetical protein
MGVTGCKQVAIVGQTFFFHRNLLQRNGLCLKVVLKAQPIRS